VGKRTAKPADTMASSTIVQTRGGLEAPFIDTARRGR
jgi:hypothetical protein